MKNFLSILIGVVTGILALTTMNVVIGGMLHIDKELILTTLPQLATMPIAISIAEQIGGIPSMTASFVVVAGITGAIIGPTVLKFFCITSTIGKGVGNGLRITYYWGKSSREGRRERSDDRFGDDDCNRNTYQYNYTVWNEIYILKCNGDDENDNMVYSYIIYFWCD